MVNSRFYSAGVLALSLVLALLISVYPLSPQLSSLRPELVCLLLIFGVLYSPHRIGIGLAWVIGLVQDVVHDSVWGAHALALAFVAYICLNSYRRLRSYTVLQQAFWVFVFVGIHQLFISWMQGLNGYSAPVQYLLLSNLITALLWPFLIVCVRKLRIRTV